MQLTDLECQLATEAVTNPWNAADGPELGARIISQWMKIEEVDCADEQDDAGLNTSKFEALFSKCEPMNPVSSVPRWPIQSRP